VAEDRTAAWASFTNINPIELYKNFAPENTILAKEIRVSLIRFRLSNLKEKLLFDWGALLIASQVVNPVFMVGTVIAGQVVVTGISIHVIRKGNCCPSPGSLLVDGSRCGLVDVHVGQFL
jgi:hypothetical protein